MVSLNSCKEYLNMATYKKPHMLIYRTLSYMLFMSTSLYVTHRQKLNQMHIKFVYRRAFPPPLWK